MVTPASNDNVNEARTTYPRSCRRLATPPSECQWIAVLVCKMDLLTLLTPKAYHFEYIPRSFPTPSFNTLATFISELCCRQTDKQTCYMTVEWLGVEPVSCNNSGQMVHTHVPLSPSSIIWYSPKSSCSWIKKCSSHHRLVSKWITKETRCAIDNRHKLNAKTSSLQQGVDIKTILF